MTLNQIYSGFRLTDVQEINELGITAYRFLHEKSGADLLWLSNDDDNRAFSIAFKTLPENSTGVFHILEHSVLCGSEKYPLREPFVDLLKGSLQTFLNAMTFPDKTVYPVASTNEKDYMNLVDVYLDAVFHPRIYKMDEIFMQEGWHYTPKTNDDEGGFSGVVYNEMKGAYSTPDSQLLQLLQEQLLPDTCYSYSSGGDPADIPNLTYEDFLNTHRRYYHPDNSYVYLYGKLDIKKMLAFLNENCFDAYTNRHINFEIAKQIPFGDKTIRSTYEVAENENLVGNSMIARAVLLCEYDDRKTQLGMQILLDALTSSNAAPLKSAILDANLGDDFSAWLDDGVQQTSVAFRLKKTDPDKLNGFNEILHSTLERLATEGIDRTLLEAQINQVDFSLRELDFGSAPGVMLGIHALSTWLYGGNPVDALRTRDILNSIRAEMQEGYFERLITQYLLQPIHAVTVLMEPSKEKKEQRILQEKERNDAFLAKLGEEGLKENSSKLERMNAYQASEDTAAARASLPHLERSDLRREIHHTPVQVTQIDGVPLRYYPLNTNGIAYITLYFDVTHFNEEQLPYLSILSSLLYELGTKQSSMLDFRNRIMMKTGELHAFLDGYTDAKTGVYHTIFAVSASYLQENHTDVISLIKEGLLETNFQADEVMKFVRQRYALMERIIVSNGNAFASKRAGCGVKKEYKVLDMTSGLGQFEFLKQLCANLEDTAEKLVLKFEEMLKSVVSTSNLTVSLTAPEKVKDTYIDSPFCFSRVETSETQANDSFSVAKTSTAVKITSGVVYDALVGDIGVAGISDDGKLLVLSKILSLDYLWNRVRMRGGAYGANASFRRNGAFEFSSFRDPHVARTYEAIREIPTYLKSFEADESEMTKYVIGAFSVLDRPRRPREEASTADLNAFAGIDDDFLQMQRDTALSTNADDIRAFAPKLKSVIDAASICTVGSAEKIDADKHLFKTIS